MDPRDQTFMTIHNLTPEANILFASDSLYDILGYQPDEVRGKSAFDYFHPDEVPFARSIHSRGVLLDKAAVLHYARILSRTGQWMSCECCFTVVHNVLVASISIYFKGERSERRARDAPQIRRIFSSSPRDPRYHMLEHLSPKFKMPPMEREPRAALILNRFTRNLTIMYATDAVAQILGVRSDELLEKPFYECIQPNCLDEAERCLESAKANESIAYLRFWYKDPRVDPNDPVNNEEEDDNDEEVEMEDGGDDRSSPNDSEMDVKDPDLKHNCMDIDKAPDPRQVVDDGGGEVGGIPPDGTHASIPRRVRRQPRQTFELEAVVSCTSDGLVVVLRRARPPIPDPQPPVIPAALNYENGLFAAPWGSQPIEPYISPELLYTFRAPLLPQYMPLRECVKAAGGPPLDQLMRSIRDVAVFAWAVTGINPNMANYSHGRRRIGAHAAEGAPEWERNNSRPTTYPPPEDLSDRPLHRKDPSAAGPFGHYPSEPPFHAYRTRHASLDDNMYDTPSSSSSSRQAGWPSAPSPSSPSSSSASTSGLPYASYYEQNYHTHHHHHHHHHHNRRPPLRPAFSSDALHDHARYQQHQHQRHNGYPPAPPSSTSASAAARRCNFGDEPWGPAAAAAGRERNGGMPGYAGGAAAAVAASSFSVSSSSAPSLGRGSSGPSAGGGGACGGAGRGEKRYYW